MSRAPEELIRVQADLGGRIGRTVSNVKKQDLDNVTVAILQKRVALMQEKWKEFSENHRKGAPEASDYLTQDYFAEIEETYLEQADQLDAWIERLTIPEEAVLTVNNPAAAKDLDDDLRLPRLNLPTFSGDLLQWESFRDLFRSLVHESTRLSKVRKFTYLKSSLTGDAAKMLARTPISEARYEGAWASLERRYGNPRALSEAHMNRLIHCSPITNGTSSEIKRILDEFRQSRDSFEALGKPVAEWDEWITFLLMEKLDSVTRLSWEESRPDPIASPPFVDLESFLENRVHILTSSRGSAVSASSKSKDTSARGHSSSKSKAVMTVKATDTSTKPKPLRDCSLCAGKHSLGSCQKYKKLGPADRLTYIKRVNLCLFCLGSGHQSSRCTSTFRCWVCDDRHHTTLHDAYHTDGAGTSQPTATSSETTTASYAVSTHRATLLATARVKLEAPDGRHIQVRALLDPGSESSFLSEWAAQALRLPRRAVHVKLTGYQGRSVGIAKHEALVDLRSCVNSDFRMTVDVLITNTLTLATPSHPVKRGKWPHVDGLPMADPAFQLPSRVDILLGADVCGALIFENRSGPAGTPDAIRTPFGWALLGRVISDSPFNKGRTSTMHLQCQDLHMNLKKFWEVEELPSTLLATPDEQACETLFQASHSRDHRGRFQVRLPFSSDPTWTLGQSRQVALQMLLSGERRQSKDPTLRIHYSEFMSEYLRLGHMEEVSEPLGQNRPGYYLPHHAVWKESGGQKKIRVVFNASCQSAAGKSLNDILLTGPKLQADLWLVITRWRLFRVAFSADMVKMYRQIQIHADDRDWLRILWRANPADGVREFRMTTVTYGTASAPYLAHRVLSQLASDEAKRYPLGSKILQRHCYVDDILAGADSVEEAKTIQREVIGILNAGGFPLDKWAGNAPGLHPKPTLETKVFQESEVHGALGLQWHPSDDTLSIRGPRSLLEEANTSWTNRTVLSEVARLFDPLGWLAPVLVRAKIILQDLWLAGVDWDDAISTELAQRWLELRRELRTLDTITIPRWVQYSPKGVKLEIHGFCDASERAYAAAVYLRVQRTSTIHTKLLVAKTKVAPVKLLSIPRWELCGAVLLARLLASLKTGLSLDGIPTVAWFDSTVTVAWIRSHAARWKPFVAHRVAEIQRLVPGVLWKHLRTTENPADLATRGIDSSDLQSARLWWDGPHWLSHPEADWPSQQAVPESQDLPERRAQTLVTLQSPDNEVDSFLISKFSKLQRLFRVTAFILRFASNARGRDARLVGPLSVQEHQRARTAIHQLCQRDTFAEELESLHRGRMIKASSILTALNPFLDTHGILRVGGRLHYAPIASIQKHPVIIGRKTHLAKLICEEAHQKTLHGGVNAAQAWIRQRYWIPRSRPLIKQVLHQCIRCLRLRGTSCQQQMGSLPSGRLQPTKPFLRTGVDYAGPLQIRMAKGRGNKSHKGYIVVFVCLSTKAVHLDAVTDLTSDAFLAAFRRFTSRRGRCGELWSDNGTTFRGADAQLRQMLHHASKFHSDVIEALGNSETEWKFIPPYSPHFGGLWEAAVKSAKTHLKRVIGDATLTYEELATLLCQIEACLNSRPLTSLSDDPHDLTSLSPGHFLVGESINAVSEPLSTEPPHREVSRWKLLTNMRDHFWHRWKNEYLHQLQQLPKWKRRRENLQKGDLVLVKDELTPPTRWPLARVLEVHPGADGLVRVVTLRTASRTISRTINKIVPLQIRAETDAG